MKLISVKNIRSSINLWEKFIFIKFESLQCDYKWTFPQTFATVLSKEFLVIQATIQCKFTLKHVRDMIITYSQMHATCKYSQHSSIIRPVWLNGWVFVYKLSGCGFECRCCSDIAPVSRKEFLNIQAAVECRFTLKRVTL